MDTHQQFSVAKYIEQAGVLHVTSHWHMIDQAKIDQFANVTNDHQFIHVDENRTRRETSFGGTIVHGFLSLSMLSAMIGESLPPIKGVALTINYGFNSIRFLAPVPSGSRIRAHIKLLECAPRKPEELLSKYAISVEIENLDKPALVAEWLGLTILEQEKL